MTRSEKVREARKDTIFVTDGENTIVIDKDDFEGYEIAGWRRGRTSANKWMRRGVFEKMVDISLVKSHLAQGWSLGRASKNLGRPRHVR